MFEGESLGIPNDMTGNPILRAMYQLARRRQQQTGPTDPMSDDQSIDYSDPRTADIIDTVNPRVKDTPSDTASAATTAPATPPASAPAQPMNAAPDALSSAIGASTPSATPGSAVTGTSDRLKSLEDQYNSRFGTGRPKGFMNTTLPGLLKMAPVIGLALAGKGRAAAGLGMGLAGAGKTQMDRTMADRSMLVHQIEDERNRAEKSREFGIRESQTKAYQDAVIEARNNARNQAPQTMQDNEGKVWQWDTGGKTWVPANGPDGKQITKTTADDTARFNPEKMAYDQWSQDPKNKGKTILEFEQQYQSTIHPKQFTINNGGGPAPTFTPIVGPNNTITGRWNNRTGQVEGLGGKGAAPTGDQARKSGLTGQAASRAYAADSITTLIDSARKQLADPEVRAAMGPLAGRWSDVEQRVGNSPAKIRKLAGTLKSIYSLGGTMHGWRALQVAENFEKTYGSLSADPDSILGGLDAMEETANTIRQPLHAGENKPAPDAGTGAGNGGGQADYQWDPISKTVKPVKK